MKSSLQQESEPQCTTLDTKTKMSSRKPKKPSRVKKSPICKESNSSESKSLQHRGGNQKFFKEEREFLESCFKNISGKWSKFETGRIAKTLGVARKKITMWKWNRMSK